MAQWLVTQGDNQFQVDGIAELKELARKGQLKGGDMIQPPGATDWVYAAEVPDLAALLSDDEDDDEGGFSMKKGAAAAVLLGVVGVIALTVLLIGGGAMVMLAQQLPSGDETIIGEGGLSLSEMLVTESGSGLRAQPDNAASVDTPLEKDAVLELLAKRGNFYRAKAKDGREGWIPVHHVIPMYQLAGGDVRDEFDPLYNPDRYVEVVSARWMQLPPEKPGGEESNVTVFELMFSNESRYDMTGLVILVTVKDARGQELEKLEIPIEGVIPTRGKTMVGTLVPEDAEKLEKRGEVVPKRLLTTVSFDKEAKDNPDLQLLFSSGIEVELQSAEFANANIDIVELAAVPTPKEEAEKK
jgi:hypothetical protein